MNLPFYSITLANLTTKGNLDPDTSRGTSTSHRRGFQEPLSRPQEGTPNRGALTKVWMLRGEYQSQPRQQQAPEHRPAESQTPPPHLHLCCLAERPRHIGDVLP